MKLFNLNIGLKIDNNKQVVELINKEPYDIVVLQESMRKLDKNVKPHYDSCDFIRNHTSYENNFFGALWVAKKHVENGVIDKDFGGYVEQGNQVLTNLHIIKASNVFYYKNYANFDDITNFRQEDHPRAFTDVILQVGEKYLQIINVHGTWNKNKISTERTMHQTKEILKHVRKDIPCILVGDFNLLPNTKDIKILSNKLHNLIEKYNIKSTRPDFNDGVDVGNLVCDYIFVNDKVKVNDFCVLNNNVSDHLPLILDFDI